MTANDLLELLLRLALASSLSILAALLLRRTVGMLFGARAAWQLWLVVPSAMLAAALPSLRVHHALVVALVPALKIGALSAPVHAPDAFSWTGVLLAAWLAGAVAAALAFAHAQRSFVASLGPLTPRGPIWYAQNAAEGPALLGLIKPKIVVPADFATRYDALEQALIIEHERRHGERGDPLANAAIALLRCLFWFNPLVHVAAARCRFDQELACDADIMQRLPGRSKAYAGAMLKTQDGSAPALTTCHWQSSHPLKERIMNLNQPAPAAARRLAGRILIAGLLCASATSAVIARADPAAPGPSYDIALRLEVGGAVSTPRVVARAGEQFKVLSEQPAGTMEGEFQVDDAGGGSVSVRMKLKNNNIVVGEPRILAKLGATSSVAVGGPNDKQPYKVTLTVKLAEKPAPGA